MLQIDGIAHAAPASRRLARAPVEDRGPRIARLATGDLPLIERFLLDTDIDTRVSRFGNSTSDAGLAAHARDATQRAQLLLGIFVDNKLRGLLEAYDCDAQSGEIALLVARAFRGKGFGTALLREAIALGCIKPMTYRLVFALDNWAMRRIAQKTNARLDLVLGEFCADIDLRLAHITAHERADARPCASRPERAAPADAAP